MPIYLDTSRTWDYVLKAERGEPNPVTFHFKVPSVRKRDELLDLFRRVAKWEDGPDGERSIVGFNIDATNVVDILTSSMTGWSNWIVDDKPVKCETFQGFISQESLGHLTLSDRVELCGAVMIGLNQESSTKE